MPLMNWAAQLYLVKVKSVTRCATYLSCNLKLFIVGAGEATDIDRRCNQGPGMEFNAPTAFVQRIKEMFSLPRVDPESWVATVS